MIVFGFYLLWVNLSLAKDDMIFAAECGWWIALAAACGACIIGFGAAYCPHRYNLGIIWLSLTSFWIISRGTTLIFIGSPVFDTRFHAVRAGIGWLCWVLALMSVVTVVLMDSIRRHNVLHEKNAALSCQIGV